MNTIDNQIIQNYKDLVLGLSNRIQKLKGNSFVLKQGRLSKHVTLTDAMIYRYLEISKSTYFSRKEKSDWKLNEVEKLVPFLDCWEEVEKTGYYPEEFPIT